MGKVDEKRLREQIQVHKKEKDEALTKMAELQKQVSPRKRNVVEFLLYKNKQNTSDSCFLLFVKDWTTERKSKTVKGNC